ncbi:MAG: hypothetical protein AAF549_04260 [Pseudomonadota bacterium]
MKLSTYSRKDKSESGNVLFLILIAVALFAALSYAVTQSTRSGSGTAERETSILNAASLTQYPASMRTSVIRMILSGTPVENMYFDSPSEIADLNLSDNSRFVFHPSGGGAIYQQAPSDVMSTPGLGTWYFNGNFDIPQIGIDDGLGANDLVAYLPGVTSIVCASINKEVGIQPDSTCSSTANRDVPDIDTSVRPEDIEETISLTDNIDFPTNSDQQNLVPIGTSCEVLDSQPTGCFYDTTTGSYVFYSVLLER